jgi:hypothetical protein
MDQLTTVLESYPVTPQTGSGVNVLVINRSDLSTATFTDSWQVAGTGITGVNAINIYTDLTSTVQQGSGATFDITADGSGSYTIDVVDGGTNYLPGHKIKILGSALGGEDVTNDLIIEVNATSEGSILTVTPTGASVGLAVYTSVSGTNYQTGSGLEFNFFGDSGSTYTEHPTEITAVGSNYVDGDVVVIPGTQLGGTTPANDLTATVSTADGAVTQFNTFSGTQQTTTYRVRTEDNGIDFSGTGTWTLNDVSTDDDDRMLVVKYNSTGTIAWQKAILFDTGFDCYGADADIDNDGNIYVTGNYQYDDNGGTTSALSILKLDSTGAKQWSRRVVGDCDTFSTSVVVGPDDKLYLSGVTGNNNNSDYTWVAAKYGIDGAVEWQRLIDNTDTWTFGGFFFFESGSGSNIAVKQDYVVLGGGFGFLPSDPSYAAVVQISATGDIFSAGDWDFKAATFSGLLNDTASDITVVNAGKTDTDNSSNITTTTAELDTEVADFLIGTLYRASGADERLVNGENELVLEANGALTLPSGGTISEGIVTSNPTIQLTPASPDVNSQKLVIKGGGSYSNTENGIYLSTIDITYTVFDTVEFYVYDPTRANETLYWWIVPEGAGISVTMSGTVALDGIGDGNFTFTLDSDAYEFRVRVSPEEDNYNPNTIGVESVLINGDAPSYGDYHLHLTTGDLEETSIFLGTDDHNVRTTTDRKIQITTPNDVNNVWEFGADGVLTFPSGNLSIGNALGSDAIVGNTDAIVGVLAQGQYGTIGLQWIDNIENIGSTSTQTQVAGVVVNGPLGSTTGTVQIVTGFVSTATTATFAEHTWTFGTDGGLTFPDGQSIIRSLNVTDGIPGLTLFAPERIYLGIASSSTSWSWDFRNYGQNDYSTDKKPAVMLPGGSVIEEDLTNQELNYGMAGPLSISSRDKLTLRTNNLDDSLTPEATYDWVFGNDGGLTFPDATVQITAFTGTIAYSNITNVPSVSNSALVNGSYSLSLGSDGVLTLPNNLTIDSSASTATIAATNTSSLSISARDITISAAIPTFANTGDPTGDPAPQWQFGVDGTTTLPSGVQISNYNYQNNMFSLEADSVRGINLYTNDRHGITVHGHANGQSTATTAVTITANAASTYDYQNWIFKADGTTEFPNRVRFTTSSFILPEAGQIVQPALVLGPVYDSQPDPTSGIIRVNKNTAPASRPYSSLDQYISPGTSMIASNGSSTSVISISSTGILDEYLSETYTITVDATWLTNNYGTGAFTFDIYDGGTWTFGTDASLTFPDNTVQTTAFTSTSYISKSELQSVVAASTDFADFQSRIAAL